MKIFLALVVIVCGVSAGLMFSAPKWEKLDSGNGCYAWRRMAGGLVVEQYYYEGGKLKWHSFEDSSFNVVIVDYND